MVFPFSRTIAATVARRRKPSQAVNFRYIAAKQAGTGTSERDVGQALGASR
jgi:hypothetical protein